MTFKRKNWSHLSSKASEPFINSIYSFCLTIFTIYAMYEIMNSRLFTFPYQDPRCWFAYGSIALLNPAVLVLLLSRNPDLR
jgi:hypothetical protein